MAISVAQSKLFTLAWAGNMSANVTAGDSMILLPTRYASNAVLSTSAPKFAGSAVGGASSNAEQSPSVSGNSVYAGAWLLPDLAGGSEAWALTTDAFSDTIPGVGALALDVSGLGASPGLAAAAAVASGTGTTASSGATGAFTGPAIVVGVLVAFGKTLSEVGAPWTEFQYSDAFGSQGYQVVNPATPTSYTFGPLSWSGAVDWAAICVAFSAAAPPASPSGLLMASII